MRECGIIRDLLPLYQEGMLSPDSVEFVEGHLKTCPDCRAERELLRRETVPEETEGAAEKAAEKAAEPGLASVRRKLLRQRRRTVILAVCLALALATALFARMTERYYFPEPQGVLTLREEGNGTMTLRFSGNVTGAKYFSQAAEGGGRVLYVSVWRTEWDRFFGEGLSELTLPEEDVEAVYFSPNNGSEDILLWGEDQVPGGGVITLPRLALVYYAAAALVAVAVLGVLAFALRRRKCAPWLRAAALIPAAYLLGEFLTLGLETVTYSMERDFLLTVLTAAFLYPALWLSLALREEHKRRALPGEL